MRNTQRSWIALFTVVMCSSAFAHGDDARSIRASETYQTTYRDFYSRLENLPGDVLVDELGEQIETALMRGRNISPVDLRHKVTTTERSILNHLQSELCKERPARWTHERIELNGIATLRSTLSAHKVQNDDYARIASVLVRIIDHAADGFCDLDDFQSLEP